MRSFASDNYAGVPPEVLDALAAANEGSVVSYGDDPVTARAQATLPRVTSAPTRGRGSCQRAPRPTSWPSRRVCRSWEAVITPATSHLNVDECGAPEQLGGLKLLAVPTAGRQARPRAGHGAPDPGRRRARGAAAGRLRRAEHRARDGLLGRRAARAGRRAHAHGLLLHVDGARLANAAAALGTDLGAITTGVGADLLSFGGTKAGLLAAEAVVFLRPGLGEGFAYVRKQHGQLVSKLRFVSAQLEALLGTDLWRRSAEHANAMARRLAAGVADVEALRLTQPVQANAVFAVLPREATERLQRDHRFYVWDEATGEVRWMCAWDTRPEDVDAFAADVRAVLTAQRS